MESEKNQEFKLKLLLVRLSSAENALSRPVRYAKAHCYPEKVYGNKIGAVKTKISCHSSLELESISD